MLGKTGSKHQFYVICNGVYNVLPFKRQPHKMAHYFQRIRWLADDLFECAGPFCEVGA